MGGPFVMCAVSECEFVAAVAWVFQQPAVRCISATVPDENPPSQGLAAKLGLVRTGETRRDLPLWKTTDHGIGG